MRTRTTGPQAKLPRDLTTPLFALPNRKSLPTFCKFAEGSLIAHLAQRRGFLRKVECSVVKVCCGGHGRAIPMLAHRDASHVLSDHARRSQARRSRTPHCRWQTCGSRLLATIVHLADSHPHALGRVLPLAASHGRYISGRRRRYPTSARELTQ